MAMRGYGRDAEEDLDEYEEDGEEPEEEVEEEEYEDEEAPQPTQEELEYLELRQRLKESFRKQMKRESNSGLAKSREKTNKLPYDNYGSFFGPSQPVIAQRVIQESKSLLENPQLAARVSKSSHSNNKSTVSVPVGSKSRVGGYPSKVTNGLKTKAQMLKNTRDYSFLLSDDAEPPAPTKDAPPRNVSVPKSEALPPKSKQSLGNSGRQVLSGHEERKPRPGGSQMQPKATHKLVAPCSKPKFSSLDSRKQLGSNNGNGPGRPPEPKALPSKIPVTSEKKVSAPGPKSSMPSVHQPPLSKLNSSVSKQLMERKKELQESSRGKMIPKQPVSSSKTQMRHLPPKATARATVQDLPKKKSSRRFPDDDDDVYDNEDDAIASIRKLFRYNPNKYNDGDDDSDMEANFDDIMREEKRSARIAAREDEEELRKIEEEERRERLRKEAKKRKLNQR